jgi:hypothetical protein
MPRSDRYPLEWRLRPRRELHRGPCLSCAVRLFSQEPWFPLKRFAPPLNCAETRRNHWFVKWVHPAWAEAIGKVRRRLSTVQGTKTNQACADSSEIRPYILESDESKKEWSLSL